VVVQSSLGPWARQTLFGSPRACVRWFGNDALTCPEVHVCSYLDSIYPNSAPHSVYAYYARAFSVPSLRQLYEQLIDAHAIDAIVLVDGGSDSLMAGDEEARS
jgi:hypothetical protein